MIPHLGWGILMGTFKCQFNTWFRTGVPPWSTWQLAFATLAVGTVLQVLGMLLHDAHGFGVEDAIGWLPGDATKVLVGNWRETLGDVADTVFAVYLLLDTACFMPLYAAWLLSLSSGLAKGLKEDKLPPPWLADVLRPVAIALAMALLIVDGLENSTALLQLLHSAPLAVAAALLALGVLWQAWRQAVADIRAEEAPRWSRVSLWVAGGLVLFLAGIGLAIGRSAGHCGADLSQGDVLRCASHFAKHIPLGLGIAAVLGATALWRLFGPPALNKREERVALRKALITVPLRSRYVLAALGMATGALLVMDQGRDVIHAWAAQPLSVGWGAAGLLTVLSLFTFGFSCYLWARLGGMVARSSGPLEADGPAQDYARDWARAMGVMPALITMLLCEAAIGDAVQLGKSQPLDWKTIGWLIALALVVLSLSLGFLRGRSEKQNSKGYLAKVPLTQLLNEVAVASKYRHLKAVPPRWLWLHCLALALLSRWLGWWMDDGPTLTLPILLFSLSFWVNIAGWMSLVENGEAVPWLLLLLGAIGLFGVLGWTENGGAGHAAAISMAAMLGWASAIAAVLGVVTVLALMLALRKGGWTPIRRTSAFALFPATILVPMGVLHLADRPVDTPKAVAARSLDSALEEFLSVQSVKDQPHFWVVAAEGGGIRNAYWTAQALAQVQERVPNFLDNVFAMSGVSGGSVGLAAFRACRLPESKGLKECLQGFGKHDLLGPLVGAWMFEDAVARLLPIPGCEADGCGFLSRGIAFEQALIDAVPQLAKGLRESRLQLADAAKPKNGHEPYLLLNATWVETGERSIASELDINAEEFPNARNQLHAIGVPDLRLASAAHNSARFPFTNALGEVRRGKMPEGAERARDSVCDVHPTKWPLLRESKGLRACGHLADGGYFENGGAQALIDVLQALQRKLQDTRWEDLRKKLDVKIWLIRNGRPLREGPAVDCKPPAQPGSEWLTATSDKAALEAIVSPRCAGRVDLFADFLGPPIAALNSIGTGSNGRLTVARLLAQQPHGRTIEPPELLDLVNDGPLMPLGWHLSHGARLLIETRAEARAQKLAP